MKFQEIIKIYRPKILTALGAVIFIASGLILYEFKFAGDDAPSSVKAEVMSDKINIINNQENNNNKNNENNNKNETEKNIDYKKFQYESEIDGRDELLNLYITGGVRRPGVYRLPPNSRIFNLVQMAGGFNNFADKEAVNLVEKLTDGAHIHIPTKSETKKLESKRHEKNSNIIVMHSDFDYKNKNNFKNNSNFKSNSNSKSRNAGNKNKYEERVNINTADAAELEKLRGIGPALAKRIIEFRDKNGAFNSVDDLKRVRGIGDAKLKGLRNQAVIN